MDAMNM
ncbi:hypothetical protein TIFTF001_054792 [Ficus carica]|nr:hypothetical protein TIFTF001_054792 [Ficus carica]